MLIASRLALESNSQIIDQQQLCPQYYSIDCTLLPEKE
jgi:hypothetical protein